MKKAKKRKSIIYRLLYHRVTMTLVGFVILIFIAVPLVKNVSKQYKINNEIRELESEIARLESKNMEFKKLVDYLESDQFVEEQARLNLGYKNQDESVVVVKPSEERENAALPPREVSPAGGKSEAGPPAKRNNALNWWNFFFK